jgi:hypothetical protein
MPQETWLHWTRSASLRCWQQPSMTAGTISLSGYCVIEVIREVKDWHNLLKKLRCLHIVKLRRSIKWTQKALVLMHQASVMFWNRRKDQYNILKKLRCSCVVELRRLIRWTQKALVLAHQVSVVHWSRRTNWYNLLKKPRCSCIVELRRLIRWTWKALVLACWVSIMLKSQTWHMEAWAGWVVIKFCIC